VNVLPPSCRYSEGPADPVAREAWSEAADNYIAFCARPDTWNKLIEIPAMREMLGEVRGKRTLEVGCGPAHYSLWLAEQGAEAWGCDPAPRLTEFAQQRASEVGVELRLRVGGVELLPEYPAASFDIVLFPMMLEYVDDLGATFREAYRLLRPDGFVAISIVHPMRQYTVKYETEDGEELRLLSGYLDRGVIEWSGWIMFGEAGRDILCRSHRRPIGDHVEALVGAGFLIEAIKEPDAPPASWEINPRRCRENQHCPQFMLIKAVKDRGLRTEDLRLTARG
jgi:SAM-dependent methyltransferase